MLFDLLRCRLAAAEKIESETGQLQNGSDSSDTVMSTAPAPDDQLSESITEVLHKAGRHMEDTIGTRYPHLYFTVFLIESLGCVSDHIGLNS